MIYGYARVSTKGQAKDGNSLEAQETALREAGAAEVYADAFTGTKAHRPQLDKLMEVLQPGDKLVVTKLDRVARSTIQGIELIQTLLDKGVAVHILNMGLLDDTPTGRLIRTVLLAFAQFERDMIVERTQEGIFCPLTVSPSSVMKVSRMFPSMMKTGSGSTGMNAPDFMWINSICAPQPLQTFIPPPILPPVSHHTLLLHHGC